MNQFQNKDRRGNGGLTIISLILIIITAIVNLIGFFKLPDQMSTQLTTSGLSSRTVSTPLYLVISFIVILVISIKILYTERKEESIKWILCNIILCLGNFMMIVIQI